MEKVFFTGNELILAPLHAIRKTVKFSLRAALQAASVDRQLQRLTPLLSAPRAR